VLALKRKAALCSKKTEAQVAFATSRRTLSPDVMTTASPAVGTLAPPTVLPGLSDHVEVLLQFPLLFVEYLVAEKPFTTATNTKSVALQNLNI
jgi:hypothetical protein